MRGRKRTNPALTARAMPPGVRAKFALTVQRGRRVDVALRFQPRFVSYSRSHDAMAVGPNAFFRARVGRVPSC
jgi:hypothetical protein